MSILERDRRIGAEPERGADALDQINRCNEGYQPHVKYESRMVTEPHLSEKPREAG